jgi:hypothetical protein
LNRSHTILRADALLASAIVVLATACRGPAAAFEVRPDSLSFDPLAIGAVSDARVVEWSNAGADSAQAVELLVSGPGAADFVVAEDLCGGSALAPGDSCTVAVLFGPRGAGARAATLSLVTRPENAAGVHLRGEGLGEAVTADDGGLVQAVPETLDFGAQPVGMAAGPLGVRLVNQRAGPVQFAARLHGGQASEYTIALDRCSNEILNAGRACAIQVMFEPTGEGLRASELVLRDLNGSGTQSVPLMGSGVLDAADGEVGTAAPPVPLALSVTPPSVEFGVLDPGSTSPVRTVRIKNEGASNVVFTALEISGSDPGSFRIARNDCGTRALIPTRTCSIGVVFEPSAPGARSARIEARATTGREPALVILGGTGAGR